MLPRRSLLTLSFLVVLLPACGTGPGNNGGFDFIPDPGEAPCSIGGSSARVVTDGFFGAAAHYDCADRTPEGGEGPRFTGHSGQTTLVAGGSTELQLDYEGLADGFNGELVYAKIAQETGFFVLNLNDGPDDPGGRVAQEIFIRPDAPAGDFELLIGVDDGSGTADNPRPIALYSIPFTIIGTAGGALQFALNWDTEQDVDLHVVDPSGEMVFYGSPTIPSGGELDLDSNAGCAIDGVQNENVLWNGASVPAGDYRVAVNLWSACGSNLPTQWRLTILQAGVPVETVQGSLSPADENPDADPLPVVTVFSYAP